MTWDELILQDWFQSLLWEMALFVWIIYAAVREVGLRKRCRELEKAMKPSRMYRRERKLVADIITDALEDAVHKGKLSNTTKNFYYRQFGDKCILPDLLPRKHPPKFSNIKEAIRARLGPGVDQRLAKQREAEPATKRDPNLEFLLSRKKSA